MDIRIINGNQIINATDLDIEIRGKYIVGLTNEKVVKNIKECENEEEAEETMDFIKECIIKGSQKEARSIIIEL